MTPVHQKTRPAEEDDRVSDGLLDQQQLSGGIGVPVLKGRKRSRGRMRGTPLDPTQLWRLECLRG